MSDPFDDTAGQATRERLGAATAELQAVGEVLAERFRAMFDAMNGWPAGRGFDSVGGRSTSSFCELHEQERCECGGGTTFVTVSDRTGEAALSPDRAKRDHDRVVALSKSIRKQADELASVLGRWSSRSATERERQETVGDRERLEGCSSCSRLHVAKGVARWEPAARTVLVGDDRRPLCEWCRLWLRQVGELPTVAQLEQHHRGVRVRRPA